MDFSSLGLGELDWVFIVIIVLSTLLGISRGMVREIFAVIGWCAAFFVSLYFSSDLAQILPFQTHIGLMTRTLIACVLIVIGCVFASGLVGKILRSILASVSIGAEDRLLGCLFGFLRGLLIVGLLVFLAGSTEFVPRQQWWHDSVMVPMIEKGIVYVSPYIPQSLMDLRK